MTSIRLSRYAESLAPDVQRRYVIKISKVGTDPYDIKCNRSEVPTTVTTGHVVQYLSEHRSPFTGNHITNTKSVEAYKKFIDGFLNDVLGRKMGNFFVVRAKVMHSMRLNEAMLTPWVIVQEGGIIESAHCTCVIGLSEACSHVSTVLYGLAHLYQLTHVQKLTVTDVPAYWMRPGTVKIKDDLYKPVEEIQYVKKVSRFIDSEFERKSEGEFVNFIKRLNDGGSEAAIIRHCCDGVIIKCKRCERHEVPDAIILNKNMLLQGLFQPAFETLDLQTLRIMASGITIALSADEIKALEERTRHQSSCTLWQWIRTGRITASIMKQCVTSSIDTPPAKQTLLTKICYPHRSVFQSAATSYGKRNEEKARRDLRRIFERHDGVTYQDECGLFISQQNPYIGASPDSIIVCNCCGKCCVEIKCPFRLSSECSLNEQLNLSDLARTNNPFIKLNSDTGKLEMVQKHDYYFQIQTQIFCTNSDYGMFFIWSTKEFQQIIVQKDEELWTHCLIQSKLYFDNIILPEILGNYFSNLLT